MTTEMTTLTTMMPVATHPLSDGEPVQTVNARELHGFLLVGKDFSTWIKDRIIAFGFVEGSDFVVVLGSPNLGNQTGRGGDRRSQDYHLTLDMAKELAMVERNERGKQARLYFIAMEKRARQPVDHTAILDDPAALRGLLLGYTERLVKAEAENNVLTLEYVMVTIDEWRASNHVYLSASDTGRISGEASRRAKARGIILEKQHRDVVTASGRVVDTAVNIYPRWLLDEAARDLGYAFMRQLPAVA